jgi:hypothetical protein
MACTASELSRLVYCLEGFNHDSLLAMSSEPNSNQSITLLFFSIRIFVAAFFLTLHNYRSEDLDRRRAIAKRMSPPPLLPLYIAEERCFTKYIGRPKSLLSSDSHFFLGRRGQASSCHRSWLLAHGALFSCRFPHQSPSSPDRMGSSDSILSCCSRTVIPCP